MNSSEQWHSVVPQITDPDLAPIYMPDAVTNAKMDIGRSFFNEHKFKIIIAVIILIIALVILYMYITTSKKKKQQKDDPPDDGEPDMDELKKIREMRKEARMQKVQGAMPPPRNAGMLPLPNAQGAGMLPPAAGMLTPNVGYLTPQGGRVYPSNVNAVPQNAPPQNAPPQNAPPQSAPPQSAPQMPPGVQPRNLQPPASYKQFVPQMHTIVEPSELRSEDLESKVEMPTETNNDSILDSLISELTDTVKTKEEERDDDE